MAGLDLSEGDFNVPRSIWSAGMTQAECDVMVTLLRIARYMPGSFRFRGKLYSLSPGQCVHSEEKIAELAGRSRKVVRNAYRKAISSGWISQQSVCTGPKAPRITTIVEWERVTHRKTAGHAAGQQQGLAKPAASSCNNFDNVTSCGAEAQAEVPGKSPYMNKVTTKDQKQSNSLTAATVVAAAAENSGEKLCGGKKKKCSITSRASPAPPARRQRALPVAGCARYRG
jgi:hypothetical protein